MFYMFNLSILTKYVWIRVGLDFSNLFLQIYNGEGKFTSESWQDIDCLTSRAYKSVRILSPVENTTTTTTVSIMDNPCENAFSIKSN